MLQVSQEHDDVDEIEFDADVSVEEGDEDIDIKHEHVQLPEMGAVGAPAGSIIPGTTIVIEPASGTGNSGETTDRYFCRKCDKGFFHRWMLERHMITHTGDQPYGCGICWKRFNLYQSCLRHIKTIHREHFIDSSQGNPVDLVMKYPPSEQLGDQKTNK